ncbi:hypothetical protein QYE76_002444 [Lolium multiflorum]|uniref:RNase H type-1 domain-containing protein n=1 Tax=Lolium multiflorum TaxID=4521 RepID=A0AAD8VZJ0_LOLMU|nr:hypothetical protein QYE76_002444 [Lolium multiflorum]
MPAKPWLKPNAGSVKLTIDGSFKDGVGGAGMMLRDDTSVIVFSACKWISPCIEPLEAELQACLVGLDLALAHSSLPVIIDTDSAQMVSMIQAPGMDRSIHSHVVSEIKVLVSASRPCSFVKVIVDRRNATSAGRPGPPAQARGCPSEQHPPVVRVLRPEFEPSAALSCPVHRSMEIQIRS